MKRRAFLKLMCNSVAFSSVSFFLTGEKTEAYSNFGKSNSKSHESVKYRLDCSKCIGSKECGLCIERCPLNAISEGDGNSCVEIDWEMCPSCGNCADVCPEEAISEYWVRL